MENTNLSMLKTTLIVCSTFFTPLIPYYHRLDDKNLLFFTHLRNNSLLKAGLSLDRSEATYL
jgi:hypothetical protein